MLHIYHIIIIVKSFNYRIFLQKRNWGSSDHPFRTRHPLHFHLSFFFFHFSSCVSCFVCIIVCSWGVVELYYACNSFHNIHGFKRIGGFCFVCVYSCVCVHSLNKRMIGDIATKKIYIKKKNRKTLKEEYLLLNWIINIRMNIKWLILLT